MSDKLPAPSYFLAGILFLAAVFYLTPLKHWVVIPPSPEKFVDPVEFYTDFQKNPDNYILVDIRPEFVRFEYPENAVLKSLFRLSEEFKSLPKSGKTLAIFCEEGTSSQVAYGFLQNQGYTNLVIVDGGRVAWKKAGLPLIRNVNYNEQAKPFLYFFEEGGLLPKSN